MEIGNFMESLTKKLAGNYEDIPYDSPKITHQSVISILYPVPITVFMYAGCLGSFSSFFLKRQMIFSTEFVPCRYSSPQAAA